MAKPPGLKEYVYQSEHDMDWLTSRRWKEVEAGIAKEYEIAVPGSLKDQRKQYGLKHIVTSTVHAYQGDTLHRIVTEVRYGNSLYKLWFIATTFYVNTVYRNELNNTKYFFTSYISCDVYKKIKN